MRVLHIASGDLWAGAEVQIFHLLKALAGRNELSLKIVLMNDGELSRRLSSLGLDVCVIDESCSSSLTTVRRLCELVRSFRPQVIHSHRYKENLFAHLANAVCGRAKLVRTAHGRNERPAASLSFAKRLILRADQMIGRRATAYTIAVSEHLAQWMREEGWPSVRCIPNGIDIDAVQESQETPVCLERRNDARHVGFVGRLEPIKRPDLFVDIAAIASRGNLNLEWHLFGDGSQRGALESRVRSMGIVERVRFHGHQPRAVNWLGSLDVLVMPSEYEGMPMVLLEALAAGTPVVGHAVGGIKEVLSEIDERALVYEQHPGDYLRAIQSVLAGRSSGVVEAGYRLLRARYSVERMAEETLSVYTTVLRA